MQLLRTEDFDLQAENAQQRARSHRHDAAGPFKAQSSYFEVQPCEQRDERDVPRSLMAAAYRHSRDIGDLSSRLDIESAEIFCRERTGGRYNPPGRHRRFAVPADDVHGCRVVGVTLLAVYQYGRPFPAAIDDGQIANAARRFARGLIGSDGEAQARATDDVCRERIE